MVSAPRRPIHLLLPKCLRAWYIITMPITIDAAGRLVIPKALRDAAGIQPGSLLNARLRDGRIEIEPAPSAIALVEKLGILVAEPPEGAGVLTVDTVNATVDRLRSERG